jgi:polyisoprenoid-binding protein YceI
MPDFHLQGQMTIKGIKREIDFPAVVGFKDGEIIAQAHFDIDRTQWNVIYGSGRFFEHLGMHLVNDIISLQLKIVAR